MQAGFRMTQGEILDLMKKNPDKWFRSKDFVKKLKIGYSSAQRCLSILSDKKKFAFIEKRRTKEAYPKIYEYKLIKEID